VISPFTLTDKKSNPWVFGPKSRRNGTTDNRKGRLVHDLPVSIKLVIWTVVVATIVYMVVSLAPSMMD
jgi:hypothetical protein